MSAVCIIPARGGSTRLPGKNKKMFHGKPIIAYSIEAAKESRLFDEIWVSTDDVQIALIAHEFGAKSHYRSEELARNEVGTQEVMAAVLRDLYPSSPPDYACCIYPCSPLLTAVDLLEAARHIKSVPAAYVVGVQSDPLADAGCFYFGTSLAFIEGIPLYGPHYPMPENRTQDAWIQGRTIAYGMPANRVCDINTMEDWSRAEQMYLALKGKQ